MWLWRIGRWSPLLRRYGKAAKRGNTDARRHRRPRSNWYRPNYFAPQRRTSCPDFSRRRSGFRRKADPWCDGDRNFPGWADFAADRAPRPAGPAHAPPQLQNLKFLIKKFKWDNGMKQIRSCFRSWTGEKKRKKIVRGMDPNYTHPLFAPNYTHFWNLHFPDTIQSNSAWSSLPMCVVLILSMKEN